MFQTALTLLAFINTANPLYLAGVLPMENPPAIYSLLPSSEILSTKTFSLNNRYNSESVNNVFKDNILLTLNYMNGNVKNKSEVDWSKIEEPGVYQFTLAPGESFAFHDQILPDIKNVTKTTNAHFNFDDGFKSDGYLMGDGVCHLASLLYWATKDAGISAIAPTSHDFAVINEVPRQFGVSIYSLPGGFEKSSKENLYITNNLDKTVDFTFIYDGENLEVAVSKRT